MSYSNDLAGTLAAKALRSETIVVAGAGTGLSAKCAEAGGADAIVIYNSGRYRMAGRGSLAGLMPYGDANRIVLEMTREIVTVVNTMPVIAGVCGTDPFRDMGRFLDELAGCGIVGVQNFPTVGLIDGEFRRALEATGMSYSAEVEMIRSARRRGLFTMPYVFTADEASAMADAGADILVAHVGLTTGGHDRRLRPANRRILGALTRGDLRGRRRGREVRSRPLPWRSHLRTVRPRRGAAAGPEAERIRGRIQHRAATHRNRHRRPRGPVPDRARVRCRHGAIWLAPPARTSELVDDPATRSSYRGT